MLCLTPITATNPQNNIQKRLLLAFRGKAVCGASFGLRRQLQRVDTLPTPGTQAEGPARSLVAGKRAAGI